MSATAKSCVVAASIHVVDAEDVGEKDAVEMIFIQKLCELDPMA